MKKICIVFALFMMIGVAAFAQMGVGTNSPASCAMLDVTSTSKGFLPPRMTTDQRNNLANKVAGLTVFDTDIKTYFFWDGTQWVNLVSNGNSSGVTMLSPKTGVTPEGGFVVKMINHCGQASVKGTIVVADGQVDNACHTAPSKSKFPIGIIYDNGIPIGSDCWVVVSGIADVLFKNGEAPTRGNENWTIVSDAAGRAMNLSDWTFSFMDSDQCIGHCLEQKSSGTDVLAKIAVHFR
jgi:hypothetical protein